MAKKKGAPENLKPVRTKEEAKTRGRNGGIKSGEVRRAQRDAKSSVRYLLGLAAKGKLAENLKALDLPPEEQTNMAAVQARLFTMAMSGNLDAYVTLMKMGGYEPEEIRKERESLAADTRRNMEVQAKMEALGSDAGNVAINMADEDDFNDVVIYLPDNGRDSALQKKVKPQTGDTESSGTDDSEVTAEEPSGE